MNAASSPRRFIAGAVCPQCSQRDKLVLFEREGVQQVECVRCGYTRREGEEVAEAADTGNVEVGRLHIIEL